MRSDYDKNRMSTISECLGLNPGKITITLLIKYECRYLQVISYVCSKFSSLIELITWLGYNSNNRRLSYRVFKDHPLTRSFHFAL